MFQYINIINEYIKWDKLIFKKSEISSNIIGYQIDPVNVYCRKKLLITF